MTWNGHDRGFGLQWEIILVPHQHLVSLLYSLSHFHGDGYGCWHSFSLVVQLAVCTLCIDCGIRHSSLAPMNRTVPCMSESMTCTILFYLYMTVLSTSFDTPLPAFCLNSSLTCLPVASVT